jgi:hypothetical protein
MFAIRRHRSVRGAALVLLLACAAALVGCSPPKRLNSAVYLRDGKPTVVVHLCSSGDRLTGLDLVENGAEPAEWRVGATDASRYSEIRLLDTPPGWTVHTSSNLLSELREGQSYRVSVDHTGPTDGNDSGVTFTMADLRSLGAGEVWSRPKSYDREVPMTLAAFRRFAKASC